MPKRAESEAISRCDYIATPRTASGTKLRDGCTSTIDKAISGGGGRGVAGGAGEGEK